jgi:hypothetical protein
MDSRSVKFQNLNPRLDFRSYNGDLIRNNLIYLHSTNINNVFII